MTLDTQLLYLLNSLAGQSPLLDRSILFFASDLAYLLVAIFIAFLFFSQYPRREKLQLFFVAAISSIIARYGVTELIRYFYYRPRPFIELSVNQLLPHTASSFPSGHATFFFAMATAIYLYNKKWGIGFFIAATLITVSRVIAGIHYPSDIIGGAVIGVLVAYATFYVVRKLVLRDFPAA